MNNEIVFSEEEKLEFVKSLANKQLILNYEEILNKFNLKNDYNHVYG